MKKLKYPGAHSKKTSGRKYKAGKVSRREAWQAQAKLETERASQRPSFR